MQAEAAAAGAVDPHLLAQIREHRPGLLLAQPALAVPGPHCRGAHRQGEDRQQPLARGEALLEGGLRLLGGTEIGLGDREPGALAQQVRGASDLGEDLLVRERRLDEGAELGVILPADAQQLQQRGRRRGPQHRRDRLRGQLLGGADGLRRIAVDLELGIATIGHAHTVAPTARRR